MMDSSDSQGAENNLDSTISEFVKMFGEEILTGANIHPYLVNCEACHRHIPFVFRPKTEAILPAFLKFCEETKTQFYPVSRGQNWGYGSSLPTQSSSALVDLSLLDHIDIDEDLGIVTLQPGVTTQKLSEFLDAKASRWMTPITGAGPQGTILGNALEKGFGLNPISDHFASIISIRAYLPNGTVYRSRLADIGAWRSDMVSQWKIGPYQEGLFSQSNFGVVINISIRLAPKPSTVNFLIVKGKQHTLPLAITLIREINYYFGGVLGGINISNKKRLESTLIHTRKKSPGTAGSFAQWVYKLLGVDLDEVQILIPIFNYDPSYRSLNRRILRVFKKGPFKTKILNEAALYRILRLKPLLKFSFFNEIWEKLDSIHDFSKLLRGVPSTFSLKVAYTQMPEKQIHNHPAKDGVGLYWFAPILRLKGDDFEKSIEILERVLPKYDQNVMWTFTVINSSLVEATIPLYFNPQSETEKRRVHECWDQLYHEFLKEGMAPYRYSIEHMCYGQYKNKELQILQRNLKNAFDPHNLVSPGRYLPEI